MSCEDIDPLAIPDDLIQNISNEPVLPSLPVHVVTIKQEIRNDDDLELNSKVDVQDTIVRIKEEIKEEPIDDAADWEGRIKVHAVGPEEGTLHFDVEDEDVKIANHGDEDEEKGEKCCRNCTTAEGWLKCPTVIRVLDTIVPITVTNIAERAKASVPDNILVIKQFSGNNGVYALKALREGIVFGPLDGVNAVQSTTGNVWRLKDGKFAEADDALGYNWMQFVKVAKDKSCKNVDIFQFKENVYFQTCTKIEKGQQLFIYFDIQQEVNENSECYFKPVIVDELKNAYACTFCCLGFNSEIRLAKHKTICVNVPVKGAVIEEMIQCVFCKVFMDRKEYSKYHLDTCLKKYQRKLLPTACGMEDDTEKSPKTNSALTPTIRKYKCPGCPATSNNIQYFTDHVLEKHGEYNCKSCKFVAYTRTRLKNHEQHNHTNRFFNCSDCNYKAKSKSLLKGHMINRHSNEERIKYNCSKCPFVTCVKVIFVRHNITHDSNEMLKFKCSLCNYKTSIFSDKASLDQHMQKRHETVHCSKCEYKTRKKASLRRHMLSHFQEKYINCTICDRRFTSDVYLQKHIKNIHENKDETMPYLCKICNKRFVRCTGLDRHIKIKHGGLERCPNCIGDKTNKDCKLCDLKPFKCTKCDYATDYKRNLKQHHYIHDDTKPFQCEVCGKQFTTKANLQVHMRVHDNIIRKQKRKNKKKNN